MAISPDLLPVAAACTGIVLRRRRLVQRGLFTPVVGLATAVLLAVVVGASLDHLDLLPKGFNLHEFSAAQTHVNVTTILVALAAGVAGMLAVETRASAAVGVAISVTPPCHFAAALPPGSDRALALASPRRSPLGLSRGRC
jgi:uncharacterized membrane protein